LFPEIFLLLSGIRGLPVLLLWNVMSISICRAPWSGDLTVRFLPLLSSYHLSSAVLFHCPLQLGLRVREEPPCGVSFNTIGQSYSATRDAAECTFTCIHFATNLLQFDAEQPPRANYDPLISRLATYIFTLSRNSFSLETILSRVAEQVYPPVYANRRWLPWCQFS
jgi:hypothetical protein